MASALGIGVVAEGVESEAQADLLRELGCPMAQGFFFGPPV
jgi:EAL domain-containing protein (putative c-di-GMP-specific phosphodiesterase class I)